MEKKQASYLDEIGACREAIGYDGPQVGLDHEQEVAPANNWGHDQRDPAHRAASIANRKKRLAKKLMRISRELEALGKMEEAYQSGVEEMSDDDYDFTDDGCEEKAWEDTDDPMVVEMGTEDWLDPTGKEASHPIEHNPDKDDPDAFKPSQMGDDEWISIGPGSFDDKRDPIGKPAK